MQPFHIVIDSVILQQGGSQSFREVFFRLSELVSDASKPAASKLSLDDYCMMTFVDGHRCIMSWEGVRGLAIELGIIELDGTPVHQEQHINLFEVKCAFLSAQLTAVRELVNGREPRLRSATIGTH